MTEITGIYDHLLIRIMQYLADRDLATIAATSRRFRALLPDVLLSDLAYSHDPKPIRGRGQRTTSITAQEHLDAAADALFRAFSIRVEAPQHRQYHLRTPRICLYRVSDKSGLTVTETRAFTVPGPFWTVEKTAAWILGGMFSRIPFVLVTPPTSKSNLREGRVTGRSTTSSPAIYARELLQLLNNGYTIGLASDSERPYARSASGNILVLRPPQSNSREVQTRLLPTLWDRSNHSLLITINGEEVTAEDLHEYFLRELDTLRAAIQLASDAPNSAIRKRKRDDDEGPSTGGGNAFVS